MNENDEYSHVQRRLCAVIAKSEWTSSRMRMQKSGEELRERRAKSHRSANQFLQELLEKRTDSDLIDDNGAVDRYHKFVRCKSTLNDDTNSTLDEFHRRLRDLNNNQRNQTTKLNLIEKNHQQFRNNLQSPIEVQHDENDIVQQVHNDERSKPSRILPIISSIPTTSTPNDTTNEVTTPPTFHADEIQELSTVQSPDTSFIVSPRNPIESSTHQHHSSLLEKLETLNSSTSSLNHPLTQTLYAPKARRPDGTELVLSSSSSPFPGTTSNLSLFNLPHLPRSLTSRDKIDTNLPSKRQCPSQPKQILHEQFNPDELYNLLDNLDNQYSQNDFTKQLEQLTLSTVVYNNTEQINTSVSIENTSVIHNNDNHEENILPNLFHPSLSSSQEKHFYTTLTMNMDDIKNIFLYTMTLSIVQLSASILLPYSILNGRRPLLKCSNETCFKKIHSKQQTNTCQVTAIESSLNINQLQQNDIILRINDQSVWGLTTNAINDILKRSNSCSLTIARLCQPFI